MFSWPHCSTPRRAPCAALKPAQRPTPNDRPRPHKDPKPLETILLRIKTSLAFNSLYTATSAQALKPDRKLTYKTAGDVKLKLDVFNPQGLAPTDQRPAIVFFFGGSWVNGKPAQFHQQARDLADLGMVAFAANYRVKKRNQTTPFESVRDAKSAVRWIREHAAELGVDPERIVASGGSAGGHLAVCTALIEGEEDEGEDLAISSVPDAVVAFNPVLTRHRRQDCAL